jgi:hypothetical protein
LPIIGAAVKAVGGRRQPQCVSISGKGLLQTGQYLVLAVISGEYSL